MPRVRRTGIILLAAVVLGLVLLPTAVRLGADWLWFRALVFEQVFLTAILSKMALGFGVGLIAFAYLYVNMRIAQRGIVPLPVMFRYSAQEPPADLSTGMRRLAVPVALLIALLFGVGATGGWLDMLQFLHRTPFGVADPVFGRDVGYYVFTLPILTAAIDLVIGLTVITLIALIPLYVLRRDVVVSPRRLIFGPSAGVHVAVLAAVLFFAWALKIFLVRIPSLLYSTTGPLVGASYSDLHAQLPALRLAAVVALAAGAMVLWGARTRRLDRYALTAVGLNLAVWLLGVVAYSTAVQRLVVAPNELERETPQLRSHIDATRRAWGLDGVETRDLSGEARLTLADIQANRPTIQNVRLWDREPLLQTFGALQEIRTYYDFVALDDDRYWVDGTYRQVLLSPRELNSAALPTRTFINEHLTFTHGMGLTLGPVNQVTEEGLPVLFIKDLPPVSSVSIQVTRPEIYHGELTDGWVIARTRQREFDYPSGDANVFTSYEGTGGVRVGSLLRRALLAARFGSLKAFLSEDVTSESRALYHRDISERAAKALPFLRFDGDPYLVVTDSGRLRWILDAYTSSRRYPYALPLRDGTNYLRNSVKVVIDAYDGDVQAYLADPGDPVVRTLAKIFPAVFRPLEAMPADLRAHLRYPEDLFRAQTDVYATYHMSEPDIFYHREDQWQRPVVRPGGDRSDPFLRHIVMRLPEERQAEFILMAPFTPRGKDNLASWMAARNDGPHYGKLVVYRFPKQSLVFGPTQIVNRINQDTEISRQVSLWDQRGSEVIRGNLLVIPIEGSLLYVQPLYLRAEGGRIPELKRVVVAYQNRVVMEETLELGLSRLFGGAVERAPAPAAARLAAASVAGPIGELVRSAAEHYRRALAALRENNWAAYGEEINRLGEVLRQLGDATASARP